MHQKPETLVGGAILYKYYCTRKMHKVQRKVDHIWYCGRGVFIDWILNKEIEYQKVVSNSSAEDHIWKNKNK